MNPAKCNRLCFLHSSETEILMNDNVLAPIDLQKDLGLIITPDSKWHQHVKFKCQKALSAFFMLCRSSPNLSTASKLDLYKSMILPQFMYACPCWYPDLGDLKKLETVQKKCYVGALVYQILMILLMLLKFYH